MTPLAFWGSDITQILLFEWLGPDRSFSRSALRSRFLLPPTHAPHTLYDFVVYFHVQENGPIARSRERRAGPGSPCAPYPAHPRRRYSAVQSSLSSSSLSSLSSRSLIGENKVSISWKRQVSNTQAGDRTRSGGTEVMLTHRSRPSSFSWKSANFASS